MTGLEDFGPPDYLEGLRRWLRSLDEDADLSAVGRQMTAGVTLTALVGRLESEAALAGHPEHRHVRIEAPILILGLPRTGTTALHKMLCCDPRNQGLELWLGQNPMPRPPRERWEAEPAFQRCVSMQALAEQHAPEMSDIHAMAADAPDECWNLLRQSFSTVTFECIAAVTGYARWWSECDKRSAYARWADNLRLVGSNDRERRWVLKDPSHLFALEALLEEVPDVLIVMTHRDPAKSIPSVCSLTGSARRGNDRVYDPARLGREQNALWARGIERAMALRSRDPDRFVDVHFHEFRAEPLETVRRIYERAGIPADAAAEKAIVGWSDSHPSKPHHYEPEQFGLTAAEIREAYAKYMHDARSTLR